MYPKIEINLSKLRHNAEIMLKICRDYGIEPSAVTKVVRADLEIAKVLVEAGYKELADSRIENIKKVKEYFGNEVQTLLLRIPMISQTEEVVKYCDTSLCSEITTAKELDAAAKKLGKNHKVILMVDLGDLREGILPEEIEVVQKEVSAFENIDVIGIGVNLACYGGVMPTVENLSKLIELKEEWEVRGTPLKIVSGGNSSSIKLLLKNKIPKEINHLRLGESIMLGRESIDREHIPNTYIDTFIIKGEIVELKEKPSIPTGEIGQDTFGNIPEFEDRGLHKRAIIAIGRQDVDLNIEPVDKRIDILGASSDHLIIDVTKIPSLKVGDKVEFLPSYGSLLQAMTSPYVKKEYKF